MLCPYCSHYAAGDATICPQCGKLLPQTAQVPTGVQAIRQGKKAREAQAAGQSPITGNRQGTGGRVHSDPVSQYTDRQIPVYSDAEVFDDRGDPMMPGTVHRRPSSQPDAHVHEIPIAPRLRKDNHPVHRRMVNWAKVLVAVIVFVFLLVIGTGLYLQRTSNGQRIMARMGLDANSTAMW